MVARWRILNTPINANVESIEKYVLAIIVLHNYLRLTENASYCPAGFVDSISSSGEIIPGNWRSSVNTNNPFLANLNPVRGCRYQQDAISMRDCLKEFVNSPLGRLEWQLDHIRRT